MRLLFAQLSLLLSRSNQTGKTEDSLTTDVPTFFTHPHLLCSCSGAPSVGIGRYAHAAVALIVGVLVVRCSLPPLDPSFFQNLLRPPHQAVFSFPSNPALSLQRSTEQLTTNMKKERKQTWDE